MAAERQRQDAVKEAADKVDHTRRPRFVERLAARRAIRFRDDVGAVEGIVKAAPARVGRIQGIAGVRRRNDKLRPSDSGDLGIDIGRAHRDSGGFRHDIADRSQKAFVFSHIQRPAGAVAMIGVDLFLQ